MQNFYKIVAIACLAACCVTESSARRSNQFLVPSESQVAPQQALAQTDQAAKQAQQAKLHYMEIGPSLKGDYKFGYDTGSGPAGQSFREETRLDDGTVKGAYGYVDANGKQRIVKYTAGKAGFVVESDQEAGQQGGQAAAAPQQAPSAPAAPHRPTPVAPPQQHHHQPQPQQHHHHHQAPVRQAAAPVAQAPQQPQQSQQSGNVNFDEPQPALTRQQAEAQHAQQLRQHQIAQQHALAQQQQLAQQQEQQQQLLIQQQQQQLAAQQQQAAQQQHQAPTAHAQPQFSQASHHQHQQQAAQQPQFAAPQQQQQHHHHQQPAQQAAAPHHQASPIVHQFNQNGHFFAQSNDANLGQLLAQQLQQLQAQQQQHQQQQPQPQQHHHHHQQPAQFNAPQPADFTTPRFAAPQAHFGQPQPQEASSQADFAQGHPVRASRHAHFQQDQQQAAPAPAPIGSAVPRNVASPQSALLALHQQQQHDAQILANLRAQQLAQLEQHQRHQAAAPVAAPQQAAHHHHQQAFQQQQSAPVQQFAAQRAAPSHQIARIAPVAPQPQNLATGPISETPVAAQPEVFGPPVIDIRTLNYSIGQQTRVQ